MSLAAVQKETHNDVYTKRKHGPIFWMAPNEIAIRTIFSGPFWVYQGVMFCWRPWLHTATAAT